MAYDADNESTQIRKLEERVELLRDIQYEESESVGEENATGPIFDQQGKFRNNINGIGGGGTDLLPLNNTWTGTNLFSGGATVRDGNFFIQNSSNITKQAKFDVSLINPGIVRTYSLPNSTTTLAGLGVVSQSWTGTNIFVGITNVRTSNFKIQNTTDPTKELAFALGGAVTGKIMTIISNHQDDRILTLPDTTTELAGLGVLSQTWTGTNIFVGNTVIRDTNFFIQDGGDITKQLNFQLSGGATGFVLTLASSISGNRTLTFPDTTTSLAGLGTLSQTWTGTNIFAGFVNVRDANYFIQNSADNTKQVKWDLASISTSTIRTLTLPNSTTTLAGLGVLSQSWTGTNNFVGITTMIDSNFGIRDFSDNTKVINFDASLISTSTTRTYSLPNSTTTLAGLGVVSQSWTGTNTFNGITNFNGNAIFNEDITLGSSAVDNITFVGETIGNIVPNTTSINDLGTPTKKFSSAWLNFSLNLFGSFTGGGTPGSSAGQAKLFTRFNGTKYELRVLFPSGISQLISTEP